MKQRIDMSEAQFLRELDKRGWKETGFMGYVKMDDVGASVCRLNAGERLRTQLAYLIQQHRRIESDIAKRRAKAQEAV